MFYIYVLQSKKDSRLYVGLTKDLKRRIKEHRSGKTWSTSRMGEMYLIFYEAYLNKKDAMRREKYLKTNKGKSTLKIMLSETLKI